MLKCNFYNRIQLRVSRSISNNPWRVLWNMNKTHTQESTGLASRHRIDINAPRECASASSMARTVEWHKEYFKFVCPDTRNNVWLYQPLFGAHNPHPLVQCGAQLALQFSASVTVPRVNFTNTRTRTRTHRPVRVYALVTTIFIRIKFDVFSAAVAARNFMRRSLAVMSASRRKIIQLP